MGSEDIIPKFTCLTLVDILIGRTHKIHNSSVPIINRNISRKFLASCSKSTGRNSCGSRITVFFANSYNIGRKGLVKFPKMRRVFFFTRQHFWKKKLKGTLPLFNHWSRSSWLFILSIRRIVISPSSGLLWELVLAFKKLEGI